MVPDDFSLNLFNQDRNPCSLYVLSKFGSVPRTLTSGLELSRDPESDAMLKPGLNYNHLAELQRMRSSVDFELELSFSETACLMDLEELEISRIFFCLCFNQILAVRRSMHQRIY